MKILELFQDMAGKWRAVVDFGDFTQCFKFKKEPTSEEILVEAQKFSDNLNIQLAEVDTGRTNKINIMQKIQEYDAATITRAQAINALDIIIPFIIKHYGDTN